MASEEPQRLPSLAERYITDHIETMIYVSYKTLSFGLMNAAAASAD